MKSRIIIHHKYVHDSTMKILRSSVLTLTLLLFMFLYITEVLDIMFAPKWFYSEIVLY